MTWPDGKTKPLTVYFGPDMHHHHSESVAVKVVPLSAYEQLEEEVEDWKRDWRVAEDARLAAEAKLEEAGAEIDCWHAAVDRAEAKLAEVVSREAAIVAEYRALRQGIEAEVERLAYNDAARDRLSALLGVGVGAGTERAEGARDADERAPGLCGRASQQTVSVDSSTEEPKGEPCRCGHPWELHSEERCYRCVKCTGYRPDTDAPSKTCETCGGKGGAYAQDGSWDWRTCPDCFQPDEERCPFCGKRLSGMDTLSHRCQPDVGELVEGLAWALDFIECEGKPDGFDPAKEPEDWNAHRDASEALYEAAKRIEERTT